MSWIMVPSSPSFWLEFNSRNVRNFILSPPSDSILCGNIGYCSWGSFSHLWTGPHDFKPIFSVSHTFAAMPHLALFWLITGHSATYKCSFSDANLLVTFYDHFNHFEWVSELFTTSRVRKTRKIHVFHVIFDHFKSKKYQNQLMITFRLLQFTFTTCFSSCISLSNFTTGRECFCLISCVSHTFAALLHLATFCLIIGRTATSESCFHYSTIPMTLLDKCNPLIVSLTTFYNTPRWKRSKNTRFSCYFRPF